MSGRCAKVLRLLGLALAAGLVWQLLGGGEKPETVAPLQIASKPVLLVAPPPMPPRSRLARPEEFREPWLPPLERRRRRRILEVPREATAEPRGPEAPSGAFARPPSFAEPQRIPPAPPRHDMSPMPDAGEPLPLVPPPWPGAVRLAGDRKAAPITPEASRSRPSAEEPKPSSESQPGGNRPPDGSAGDEPDRTHPVFSAVADADLVAGPPRIQVAKGVGAAPPGEPTARAETPAEPATDQPLAPPPLPPVASPVAVAAVENVVGLGRADVAKARVDPRPTVPKPSQDPTSRPAAPESEPLRGKGRAKGTDLLDIILSSRVEEPFHAAPLEAVGIPPFDPADPTTDATTPEALAPDLASEALAALLAPPITTRRVVISTVPEPASGWLLIAGLAALAVGRRSTIRGSAPNHSDRER